jgi:Copper transport outer membrane protein, MctB
VIDFRYHLVSIVAVFLALAIGIVLGSTELQGTTIDGLRSTQNSLKNQLSAAQSAERSYASLAGASDAFLQTAEPKLLADTLAGDRIVLVTEPGAASSVISGVKQAATLARATVTGTIALQPKFNDLSGATESTLSAINDELASADGATLGAAAAVQTVYQQQAAQLIASATLDKTAAAAGSTTASGLTGSQAQGVLEAYAQGGYLTTSGTPTDRATLAVLITPGTAPTDGTNDPADQVLLAVAQEFATASAATLAAGSVAGSAPAASAISVLRSSSVSSQVSSVDNADTVLGQISTMWALANQLAGGKPNSYGISGASAVSPDVPSPVPSVTPTASGTSTQKVTGKAKKIVEKK